MTTVTLPNATDAASFEADLDKVNNGATNTDYIIPITQSLTIATTDADTYKINGVSQGFQAAVLPSGSTLTLNGPGTLTIAASDQLVVIGQMTAATPVIGAVSLYQAILAVGTATTGTTPAGGIITGSVVATQAGSAVQNLGQINGSGAIAVNLAGGGVVNASGATITDSTGGAYTVDFTGTGLLQNAGTITATGSGSFGAVFAAGGTLTNGGLGETTQAILSADSDAAIFDASGTVTNDGAITSANAYGIQFFTPQTATVGTVATVTNGSATDALATITATSTTGADVVADSGSVTNFGTMTGGRFGVYFGGDAAGDTAQVTNTGSITAKDATGAAGSGQTVAGVVLSDGGNVTNGASNGTVASSASIAGTDIGVDVLSGTSTVTNSGTISGTIGINFTGNSGNATGTVIDYGAITSTAAQGTAILFGTGAEKLVLEKGFAITGNVTGGTFTSTDTTTIAVEAGTTGTFKNLTGGAGTVSNGGGSATNGFAFTAVQAIDIDSSASWAFSGTNAIATVQVNGAAEIASGKLTTTLDPAGTGGTVTIDAGAELELVAATGSGDKIALAGAGAELLIDTSSSFGKTSSSGFTGDVIGQFVLGSHIDVANVAYSKSDPISFNASTGLLTIGDGTNNANISFTPGLFKTTSDFVITTDGLGGTLIAACYCPGTRITTPDGEIAIETLAIGDRVTMVDGRVEQIRWIGHRTYAGRFLAANPKVNPIRFRKGSLGKGLPRRDLLVSPEHAMFIDGKLIPARCLVNGASITAETSLKLVEYIHIEFAKHEVVLAEGAPSESFVDDDSRAMFHNASEYAELYPNAEAAVGYYADRLDGGFELEATRTKLIKIAHQAAKRRGARKLKAA